MSESSRSAQNALEDSLLHRLLVLTDQLQALPAGLVLASLIANALIGALAWGERGTQTALLIGGACLAGGLVNWLLLWLLPQTGRSYGPDRPSALALSAVTALLTAALGLFGAPPALALTAIVAISGLAYYTTWIEPFALSVTRQVLETDAWTSAEPLRVLHIGDIHIERAGRREAHLNALVEALAPDLILFSGDFVNLSYTHDEAAKAGIRRVISAWEAPLGVYCVPGTPIVEPLERVGEFVAGVESITLLANRWVTIDVPGGRLGLLGLITTHDLPTDRAALADLSAEAPGGGLLTVLAHSPDVAPEAAEAGFDWYLCGHTHGGQIRLPLIGALFSSSRLGRRFVMGRYALGKLQLYVTRGVGMEGLGAPRARLLCPPEIVLWEVRGVGTGLDLSI